jgi:KTSC domain
MSWTETPNSSNIARFRYTKETMVLTVEFKNGGRYDYYDVPENIYNGMKSAASVGQFLAQNIKGKYRYARA